MHNYLASLRFYFSGLIGQIGQISLIGLISQISPISPICPIPHSSFLIPHSSFPIPHSSLLITPYGRDFCFAQQNSSKAWFCLRLSQKFLIPHSSFLIPHSSFLIAWVVNCIVQTSTLFTCCSLFDYKICY